MDSSYPCGSSPNCQPISLTLSKGLYLFEAWGADGGGILPGYCDGYESGGKGGYTSATLSLKSTETFYFYIGQKGNDYPNTDFAAYNGGGLAILSGAGGGATDVRLVNGEPGTETSYNSRILVAGGGGGTDCNGLGAPGGGLYGGNATNGGFGGTQMNGGSGTSHGQKWAGASVSVDCASGGGGYFGGGSGIYINGGRSTGAGGGSGYISGHPGCEINPDYTFIDPVLLSGDEKQPNKLSGDGHIRVSIISFIIVHNCMNKYIQNTFQFLFISLFFDSK